MKRNLLLMISLFLSACSAGWHTRDVQDAMSSTGRLTAGTVQRSIRVGMTSAEVINVLGAPNIVSTDEQRREVWVYDKIATDVAYSTSSGYGTLLLLGGSGDAGARSTNQRTLTIAIKFDEQHRVRDFSYHQSSF